MKELYIYILCGKTNKEPILKFINEFNKNNDIKLLNDQVMVIPSSYSGNLDKIKEADYEWVNVNNIDDVIGIGLATPYKAFSSYFKINHKIISSIILTFTIDNYLILGLTLADTDENYTYSKELLNNLDNKYNAIAGAIFSEQIPPLSKEQFFQTVKSTALFKWASTNGGK